MLVLATPRLDLIAATARLHTLELEDRVAFAEALDSEVDPAWPPGEYDADAIAFFRDQLAAHPERVGWLSYYVRLREGACLVGAAGYFGPPEQGQVEIGYSLLEAHQGKGYATEVVLALDARARSQGVRRVIAHTAEVNAPSQRVLERCGFVREGPGRGAGSLRYGSSTA